METDNEVDAIDGTSEYSDISGEIVLLPSSPESSDSESVGPPCKCTFFVQQPDLSSNVFYPCLAQDNKYGVVYRCSQRAEVVLLNGVEEKVYCERHAAMFRDHRQCQYCRAFCIQGNFIVCKECGWYHWTDSACARVMQSSCSHCSSSAPPVYQWNFHPEESELFNRLSSIVFDYNTGSQLNLLSLCDGKSKQRLLDTLESATSEDTKMSTFESISEAIARGDSHSLLLYILFNVLLEGNSSVREIQEAIGEAIRRDDSLSLLILLQFVDIRPSFASVAIAVQHGNARAVSVLLHHGAPLRAANEEDGTADLLNDSLQMGKWDVAEEILKFIGGNEDYIGGTNDTLIKEAIDSRSIDRLKLLMRYRANVCVKDERGESVLHHLARCRDRSILQMAKVICNSGCVTSFFLDATNNSGQTAVSIACEANNWDMLKLLLEYGASPDGIPIDMKTPPALQSLIERFRAEFQLKKLIPDTRVYVTRDLTMGKERYPITVENDVGDGAVLDEDFEYASTVLDLDVFRCRIDFSLACCCVDNCQSHCPCVSRCVYDSSGRLTDKVREMAERQELGVVLECNASCFCSSQCPSRVAQSGVRSHLEVYRSRRYGWAVRSTVPIQKGEFISEYTGELISGEEADKREDDTYLFEIVVGFDRFSLFPYICGVDYFKVGKRSEGSITEEVLFQRRLWLESLFV